MLYALSVLVVDDTGGVWQAVGDARAASIEEAERKCLCVAHEKYPTEDGFHHHNCLAKPIDFGMDVSLVLRDCGKEINKELHNVSEIHYYSPERDIFQRITFCSDIHEVARGHIMPSVIEFKITPSEKVYDEFEREVT